MAILEVIHMNSLCTLTIKVLIINIFIANIIFWANGNFGSDTYEFAHFKLNKNHDLKLNTFIANIFF